MHVAITCLCLVRPRRQAYKSATQLHTAAGKRLGVGPAAEPPRPTHSIAASRQLQFARRRFSVGAATAVPLCRCEHEAARS
jgi:hypothetical protein